MNTEMSHVIIFCFSLVDRKSFEDVQSHWLPMLTDDQRAKNGILLLGLKKDLFDAAIADGRTDECVDLKEVQEFAQSLDLPFLTASGFTGEGVDDVVKHAGKLALKYAEVQKKAKRSVFQRLQQLISKQKFKNDVVLYIDPNRHTINMYFQ